uniref:Uncharacterized protein n=1 Tax=Cacopsylla melanoneura TaxID=428564 RepID=A0A8D8X646_9HEMI
MFPLYCRCDHGHLPLVLGSLLLREHHRRILQDLYPRLLVQDPHLARLLEFFVQSDHLFHLQQRVPRRVQTDPDNELHVYRIHVLSVLRVLSTGCDGFRFGFP